MADKGKRVYEFASFRLDVDERRLLRGSEVVVLPPKAFDVLVALVEHHGHLLEKGVLLKMIWPDSFVEENNLADNVSRLRKVLRDGEDGEFIETVPKRGYRFIGEVKEVHGSGPAPVTKSDQTRLNKRRAAFQATFLLVVATLGAVGLHLHSSPAPTIESLAVLPFDGAPEVEYLSEGISEGLIDSLSSISQLQVAARATAFRYRGKDWNPRQVGQDLHVGSVLTGKLALHDQTLTLQVDLVNAATGTEIWGGRYERNLSDILSLQDEVVRQVTDTLRVTLTGGDQRQLARHGTNNPEAYQLYLSGVFLFSRRTSTGIQSAMDYFHQAIAKDPNYALAYAALANCYVTSSAGGDPRTLLPQARAAAMRALEIDRDLAEAHASLGWIKWIHDVDVTGAESQFKEALRLSPTSADSHYRYARLLADVGRFEEARAHVTRAIELDQLSIQYRKGVPYILYLARRYDEAITEYKKLTETAPEFMQAQRELGLAYEQKGAYVEALEQLQKIFETPGNSGKSMPSADVAHVYAVWGRRKEARQILAELIAKSKTTYVSDYDVAVIYAGLGETDHAFTWLDRAIEQRPYWLVWLKLDPRLENLRSDARFSRLLQRVAL
jgi:DNA-binding winged helix-turn-helix (wHTH) protein/TolB-like protein/tetratricopeptide (TPR) repeat protein